MEKVKGLYLTAYSAGNSKKIDEIINLINKTELNAVIIDIKDYSGKVLYDSNLLWVEEFKAEANQLGDVRALIKKLHANNIYVIARQTVFQDPLLAGKKPPDKITGEKRNNKEKEHNDTARVYVKFIEHRPIPPLSNNPR